MEMLDLDLSAFVSNGKPTDEETKAVAYQAWVFVYNRNATKVAAALNLSDRDVQRWAKVEDWEGRARRDLDAIMPDLINRTAVNLRLMAFDASVSLREMAAKSRDGGFISEKQVKALLGMLAHGGFSPVGRNPLPENEADRAKPLPQGDTPLTREELLERHRRAVAGEE